MDKHEKELNDIIAEAINKKTMADDGAKPEISSDSLDNTLGKSAAAPGYGANEGSGRGAGEGKGNKGSSNSGSGKSSSRKKRKKKSKAKRAILITLLVILIVLVVVAAAAFIFIMSKINKMNLVDRTYDNSIYESIEEDPPEVENPNSEPDSPDSEIEDLQSQIDSVLDQIETIPLKFSDDVYNILLIGSDARSANERGRSDSMILISINKKSKQIVMTSIMRDIYLAIPNKSYNRINAAYSWGGADLLIQTIEDHFRVKIDKFVQVNFGSFEKVVDAVGGVDMYINDAEMSIMKQYLGDAYHGAGTYHLNGYQALKFARIRYVGNADFERTQRQRRILEEIIKSAKSLSIAEMNDLLDTILPLLTTDLQKGEILDLIVHSGTYLDYERVQLRIPYDGSWWNMRVSGMAVLGIDFEANRNKMWDTIYGD